MTTENPADSAPTGTMTAGQGANLAVGNAKKGGIVAPPSVSASAAVLADSIQAAALVNLRVTQRVEAMVSAGSVARDATAAETWVGTKGVGKAAIVGRHADNFRAAVLRAMNGPTAAFAKMYAIVCVTTRVSTPRRLR
jgi:hypothetical protein